MLVKKVVWAHPRSDSSILFAGNRKKGVWKVVHLDSIKIKKVAHGAPYSKDHIWSQISKRSSTRKQQCGPVVAQGLDRLCGARTEGSQTLEGQ